VGPGAESKKGTEGPDGVKPHPFIHFHFVQFCEHFLASEHIRRSEATQARYRAIGHGERDVFLSCVSEAFSTGVFFVFVFLVLLGRIYTALPTFAWFLRHLSTSRDP